MCIMMKKAAAIIFSLAILLFTLPPAAYAVENDFIIEDEVLVYYTGLDGEVTIPNGVRAIGTGVFERDFLMTGAVIPESVIEIGFSAFQGCDALTDITIPESVDFMGEYAFGDCEALKTVTLLAGIVSFEDAVFANCTSLTDVYILGDISKFNPDVFRNCDSLTDVHIAGSCAAYTDIDGVVYNKEKTELFFFPNGRTGTYTIPDGVTAIGSSAFRQSAQIESIEVPDSVTGFNEEYVFPWSTVIYGSTGSAVAACAHRISSERRL